MDKMAAPIDGICHAVTNIRPVTNMHKQTGIATLFRNTVPENALKTV